MTEPTFNPADVEKLPGYWLGRAAIRTEEAVKRAGSAEVPSDGDVRQHQIAREYELVAARLPLERRLGR